MQQHDLDQRQRTLLYINYLNEIFFFKFKFEVACIYTVLFQ